MPTSHAYRSPYSDGFMANGSNCGWRATSNCTVKSSARWRHRSGRRPDGPLLLDETNLWTRARIRIPVHTDNVTVADDGSSFRRRRAESPVVGAT